MLRTILVLAVACTSLPSFAAKDCDELKAEIAKKLDDAGVKSYTLEIVESDKVAEAKVVGSCAAGTKRITYTRK